MGILSFNGNKIVTTGFGGAILTNSAKLAKDPKHLTTTAKIAHPWDFIHDTIGYNYRLANINASLGISQLKKLSKYLSRKRKLFFKYNKMLKNCKDYYILNEPKIVKATFGYKPL